MNAGAIVRDALTGRSVAWPPDAPASLAGDVVAHAEAHGVVPLLGRAIHARGSPWPMEVREALHASAAGEAVLEQCRCAELRAVLDALAAHAIDGLVFKGAALAYVVYDEPWLRPRRDADLLVRPHQADAAARVLRGLGYTAAATTSGRYVSGQNQWIREDAAGVRHAVDLHWRVSNAHAFAKALPFEDLWAGSVAIEPLGCGARTPSRVNALLLACLHRVAHHYDSDRLLWLHDIRSLASALSETERDTLATAAARAGIARVCANGVQRAHAELPSAPLEALCGVLPADGRLPRAFAAGAATQTGILLSDLRALDTWRARAALVQEHLFPPASYMRDRYADAPSVLLPWLYARRIAGGAVRWVTPR